MRPEPPPPAGSGDLPADPLPHPDPAALLEQLRRDRRGAGLFLDFDGTLSEIVPRPELARPLPGVVDRLSVLVDRYALVAVVSGRPGEEVRRLVGSLGIQVFGLYGLELEGTPERPDEGLRRATEALAGTVGGAWVEDKGSSLAVHYRQSPDPEAAERYLRGPLSELAARHGLVVFPGRMVLELAPQATPGKGAVVLREARARDLAACLYAGDDAADLDAFAALDTLRQEGRHAVKVAIRSSEGPSELTDAADLVAEGPGGLLEILRRL